jgi:hypothetical protein
MARSIVVLSHMRDANAPAWRGLAFEREREGLLAIVMQRT